MEAWTNKHGCAKATCEENPWAPHAIKKKKNPGANERKQRASFFFGFLAYFLENKNYKTTLTEIHPSTIAKFYVRHSSVF